VFLFNTDIIIRRRSFTSETVWRRGFKEYGAPRKEKERARGMKRGNNGGKEVERNGGEGRGGRREEGKEGRRKGERERKTKGGWMDTPNF